MAARPLPSQEFLRECFLYDPETGVLTWRERPLHHFEKASSKAAWDGHHSGKEAGCIVPLGYRCVSLYSHPTMAHRIIFKLMTGRTPTQVDHKDGDGTNNRWDNLREATATQNNRNSPGKRSKNPWMKGVRATPGTSNWQATISADGIRHYLGTFATEAAAHNAYCEAAQRLHGEFANIRHQR